MNKRAIFSGILIFIFIWFCFVQYKAYAELETGTIQDEELKKMGI